MCDERERLGQWDILVPVPHATLQRWKNRGKRSAPAREGSPPARDRPLLPGHGRRRAWAASAAIAAAGHWGRRCPATAPAPRSGGRRELGVMEQIGRAHV